MNFLRNTIRSLTTTRNYQSYTTQKIKTSKFTVIRRKRQTSSIGKLLSSISYCIAILCIFEAAVWFTNSYTDTATNTLKISYISTRISLYQTHTTQNPFEIFNTLIKLNQS
eukprot:425290_1